MWQVEWRTISARINALLGVASFTVQAPGGAGADDLLRNLGRVTDQLRNFLTSHQTAISPDARQRIEEAINAFGNHLAATANPIQKIPGAMTVLASLRAELDYLFSDIEMLGRSLVNRAFQHLQRSIIADRHVKNTWRVAFRNGEVQCERLGACHLLLHGVWAFKADAGTGGRTDLVLGTALDVTSTIRSSADVLVLTEWKKVELADFEAKYDVALSQAKLYSSGPLAGFELAARRYLVFVSDDYLPSREPHLDGSCTYECINVAVSASSPSTAAKKLTHR